MRLIGSLLAVKIDCRVARIIRRRRVLLTLRLETFQAGPCLDQRPVNREMFVRSQPLFLRLTHHMHEKRLGDVTVQ